MVLLQPHIVVDVVELFIFHIEYISARDSSLRDQHTFRSSLRDFDIGRDAVRPVKNCRRIADGNDREIWVKHILATICGYMRPFLCKSLHKASVQWQNLVLAGLCIPAGHHLAQPFGILIRKIMCFGRILRDVIELPVNAI